MSGSSHFPRTNKELEKLAKQWFFRCFQCNDLFHSEKRPGGRYFCRECKAIHVKHQRAAAAAMASARRNGWNDRPENYACADCGIQAEVWEHRSYLNPLDVVATCHSCNVKRGPASWSKSPPSHDPHRPPHPANPSVSAQSAPSPRGVGQRREVA